MDLSKLRQLQSKAQEELDDANSRGNQGGLKILYPFENGLFRIKLLYDDKSGLLQRKLIRHNVGNKKIPCLSMYGEDCPICEAVRKVQDEQGDNSGVFRKYGYKTRGICHAVLINDDKGIFKKNDINVGDPVIFMYSTSLYNQINELVVRSGENIESLVASNNGKTVEIERKQNGNGPIEYKASVYAFGDEKVKNTDEEFDKLIEEFGQLTDDICPSSPTEEIREMIKAAVETINAEYSSGEVIRDPNNESSKANNVSNNDSQESKGDNLAEAMNAPVNDESSNESDNQSSGNYPNCFGKEYSEGSDKCITCEYEVDCLMASN